MEILIQELVALPHETEWVEFKRDNTDPDEIGQYISALSNSAALLGKSRGYLVWGVDDATHAVAGTRFRPRAAKVGNEDLENWLARLLSPRIDFRFHECDARGRPVVLLEVPAASHTPVRFRGEEYVRVGSYRKPLRDYPEKERTLWQVFSRTQFEEGVARERVPGDEVLALLDYPAYFGLTGQPLPTTPEAILHRLQDEEFLAPAGRGRFSVTNLGGVAFGKDLGELGLQRKAVRVITYRGTNRIETLRERTGLPGYAASFERLIDYIVDGLPANEHIGRALRYETPVYPPVAVRELVANALIHQDFHLSGTGPMVEIFSDRIEITNPGIPLIEPARFLDLPPRSRNEKLAALMRRLNVCEERGSGIDKVVSAVEAAQLPAPEFLVTESHTRVVLFAYKTLRDMSREDRVRACYQHAGLEHVSGRQMTNTTLRERLGIAAKNYAIASRIIADTIDAGLIKPFDPANRSRKHARYVPFWA